jgi:putative glycosyltransferase (TIGR04372 family)
MNLFFSNKSYNFFLSNKTKQYKKKVILHYLFSPIGFLLGLFFYFFIILIRKFFLIRYSYIKSTRIGHCLDDIDLYLSSKKNGKYNMDLPNQRKSLDLFYLNYYICNDFVAKILKRNLLIVPYFFFYWLQKIDDFFIKYLNLKNYNQIGCFKEPNFFFPPQINRDQYDFWNNNNINFNLTQAEVENGYKRLEEMGINKNEKYICIYARDSKYLDYNYPYNDWSEHNYRDVDINLYEDSVKELIKRNFKIIRVGKDLKVPMIYKNKNLIDYSFSRFRDDFMDIFLIAKCEYFVSSSSGIDAIARIFRKKIIFPFLFPVMDVYSSSSNHYVAFRHLFSEKLKRNLTLNEILRLNYGYIYSSIFLKENNLRLENLNKKLISDYIIDCIEPEKNISEIENNEIISLENKFYKIFSKFSFYNNKKLMHRNINFRISRKFLLKNKFWLE